MLQILHISYQILYLGVIIVDDPSHTYGCCTNLYQTLQKWDEEESHKNIGQNVDII